MKLLCTFILILFLSVSAFSVEDYQYFNEAQSLDGPTGNIQTFSPYVLPYQAWSFGLHRFTVGLGYGLLRHLELGINFDLKEMTALFPLDEENLNRKGKEISLHAKYSILREEEHPFNLAVGHRRGKVYLVTGAFAPSLWDTGFQGGIAWERNELSCFFALTKVSAHEQIIIDYDSGKEQLNAGWRFLVSPEMSFDFFLTDCTRIKNIFFDNFVFGLTIAG